eukprot:GHVQ01011380.1.p1 GENE.GHVQ01011380.1~~GHVQ01011380.1.p1  ORF type:complete len:822 (-),score=56.33 GHVQ01011380.1:2435-4900(-)
MISKYCQSAITTHRQNRRDLRMCVVAPSIILRVTGELVKLIDFGFSTVVKRPSVGATSSRVKSRQKETRSNSASMFHNPSTTSVTRAGAGMPPVSPYGSNPARLPCHATSRSTVNVSYYPSNLQSLTTSICGPSNLSASGVQCCKQWCGTPSYMCPEILARKLYDGFAADVWAMGILLFALLTGSFPFSGQTDRELYRKISRGTFRLPDFLSAQATRLVKRLLTTCPSERPSVKELLQDEWLCPKPSPLHSPSIAHGGAPVGCRASSGCSSLAKHAWQSPASQQCDGKDENHTAQISPAPFTVSTDSTGSTTDRAACQRPICMPAPTHDTSCSEQSSRSTSLTTSPAPVCTIKQCPDSSSLPMTAAEACVRSPLYNKGSSRTFQCSTGALTAGTPMPSTHFSPALATTVFRKETSNEAATRPTSSVAPMSSATPLNSMRFLSNSSTTPKSHFAPRDTSAPSCYPLVSSVSDPNSLQQSNTRLMLSNTSRKYSIFSDSSKASTTKFSTGLFSNRSASSCSKLVPPHFRESRVVNPLAYSKSRHASDATSCSQLSLTDNLKLAVSVTLAPPATDRPTSAANSVHCVKAITSSRSAHRITRQNSVTTKGDSYWQPAIHNIPSVLPGPSTPRCSVLRCRPTPVPPLNSTATSPRMTAEGGATLSPKPLHIHDPSTSSSICHGSPVYAGHGAKSNNSHSSRCPNAAGTGTSHSAHLSRLNGGRLDTTGVEFTGRQPFNTRSLCSGAPQSQVQIRKATSSGSKTYLLVPHSTQRAPPERCRFWSTASNTIKSHRKATSYCESVRQSSSACHSLSSALAVSAAAPSNK